MHPGDLESKIKVAFVSRRRLLQVQLGSLIRQVERLLGGPDPVTLKLDERSFMRL